MKTKCKAPEKCLLLGCKNSTCKCKKEKPEDWIEVEFVPEVPRKKKGKK